MKIPLTIYETVTPKTKTARLFNVPKNTYLYRQGTNLYLVYTI